MAADNPFSFASGLAPNLIPNPPGEIPAATEVRDGTVGMSPFSEPQDIDAIIKNLVLDRPLKLFIPQRDQYPEWDFRIINSIPQEIAAAHNKGYREVSDPKLTELFTDLVAGTDKTGKAYRPILVARPKAVSAHIRKQLRKQLQSAHSGMDPKNKELNGKYTENVLDGKDKSFGQFTGAGIRIRV